MKHIYAILLMLVFSTVSFAQENISEDVITKTNGDVVSGKVTEMNDDNIKFTHQGETLVYTVKKTDIAKIHFASGRVEVFNASAAADHAEDHLTSDGQSTASASSRNKVAILPFSYLIDKQDAGAAMDYKVQTEAFNFLASHSGIMQVQDPATTNALLIKAGITKETVRGFTPAEICKVLDVEYIVQGTITQDKTGVNSTGSQTNYYDNQGKTTTKPNYYNPNTRTTTTYSNSGSNYGTNYNYTYDKYETTITMSVVNNQGRSVFSDSHKSFWGFDSAYKLALQYMLKRTPFYTK